MTERRQAHPVAGADAALARAIASAKPGEARAEESELFRRFAPRVRLYGLRHLRDRTAAEDLVQQVLLVTLERLRAGEVRNPDEIGSFILGTSRLIAGSQMRRDRRRRELLERFGHLALAELPHPDPPDLVRVESCLQKLGERDRMVLILSFYVDRSTDEIGRELGLAAGAVRVVRHRALGRLRRCLDVKEVG